ncbi:MAG: ABC transporter permease [Muribaculaceae bacterium]|nr:ABC transporter permease [Muribaculaceae bacterium]
MTRNVVWRLLRRNISAAQLAGYAVANLVGLAIVITAIQFYRDVTSVWDSDDSFISRDYLILSHRVSGLGSMLGGAPSFSDSDIADIEKQPWVRRVGRFTSSAFNVSASVDMGGRALSTALFLESIPSEYFDVTPDGWQWTPGEPVPVIISKEYLTLYNFGFASSRGLPQISERMVSMIPLQLSLSGAGRQQWVPARIAGFSARLNTIAVPEEFMEWANARFADEKPEAPSRLIVEVNTPGDPAIQRYMEDNGLETAGDKVDNGRAAYFLNIATGVVIAVGGIISLLAFFILLLSIYLLIQKNRDKLHDLMLLGYTPDAVARLYYMIIAVVNGAVLVGAIAVMLAGRAAWKEPMESIGIYADSPYMAIAAGVGIMAVITAANFMAIRGKIRRTFPRP